MMSRANFQGYQGGKVLFKGSTWINGHHAAIGSLLTACRSSALEVKKNWEQFFPSSPRLCAMDTSVPTKKAPGKLIVADS